MMPPTSIDGTDITGATIDGQDVEEITVDGQTVFSGVSLSNKAVHQWKFDEGSGSTINDSIGSVNGTLDNTNIWTTNNYEGGSALDFGTGDLIDFGPELSVILPVNPPFAIGFTYEDFTRTDDTVMLFNGNRDGSNGQLAIGHRGLPNDFGVNSRINSNTQIEVGILDQNLPKNGKHRLLVNVTGQTSAELHFDGFGDDSDPSAFVDGVVSPDNFFGVGSQDGKRGAECVLDNLIIYNDSLNQTEIENDYLLQPWT